MKKYQSHAGYFGAISLVILSFILIFLESHQIITITNAFVYVIVGISFIVMLISELFLQIKYIKKHKITVKISALSNSNLYILKSSIIRFIALFIPFLIAYALVQKHRIFFYESKEFFNYLLVIFSTLSIPYIFFTLKFKGDKSYEIGDYAIITIVGVKSFYKHLFDKNYKYHFYKNRRVKKVARLYLVNLIFLSLMSKFVIDEFNGFKEQIQLLIWDYDGFNHWYNRYRSFYLVIFHLLFIVDVSIAIIGYSFASRWLYNRTKSVDATLSGWMIALMCYPPLNSVSGRLISYNGLDTHQLITNEYALSIILTLLIVLYSIYVWATVALGFKFSNLTNRGIVDIGPYKYVRHPAYVAKNSAWWIDNTFVLTNIWATIAMALWNLVYATRALTEERHLKQDNNYLEYCDRVKYKFIPKLI